MRLFVLLLCACASPVQKVLWQATLDTSDLSVDGYTLHFTEVQLRFAAFEATRGEARLLLGKPHSVTLTNETAVAIADWQSISAAPKDKPEDAVGAWTGRTYGLAPTDEETAWRVAGDVSDASGVVKHFDFGGSNTITCERPKFSVVEDKPVVLNVDVKPQKLFPTAQWLIAADTNADGTVTSDEVLPHQAELFANTLLMFQEDAKPCL